MAYLYPAMNLPKNKAVLFACMDWGLGHATRSVPLIRQLSREGNEVILASAGRASDFLKAYFPELQVVAKPTYNIRYSSRMPLTLTMLAQSVAIFKVIEEEKKWTEEIVKKHKIEAIFSDNCYGVFHPQVHSTLITHQLMLKSPRLLRMSESFLHQQILKWVASFDQCLVPDVEGSENLSGDLSHLYPLPPNTHFIGAQSRFQCETDTRQFDEDIEVSAIISGPEPQRTILEEKIKSLLKKRQTLSVIIRGIPGNNDRTKVGNIIFYNHISDEDFRGLMEKSKLVVCRSGYSSIMDLFVLTKKALLIPTPGQTEQEYLGSYLASKGLFNTVAQKDFTMQSIDESLRG